MAHKLIAYLIISFMLPLLASCGGGNNSNVQAGDTGDEIPLRYAGNLRLYRLPGYVRADVRNPWDTTKILHTYILVPDSLELPGDLPQGTVVRTPLSRSLVYSSVHNSLVTELGALESVKGVCDARYIHQKELTGRIADGTVADCGNSMSPDIERIIKLDPDGILLSPFENSGTYGKLGQLGIPIIECADYMETSPLARAEWMRFYGMLYGREETADSLFKKTESGYLALKKLVSDVGHRPKILVDKLYGSSWNVPSSHSTMGLFIEDAGGENPFSYIEGSGSTPLSGEQVLHKAQDADIWIVRYSQDTDKTIRELAADNALYPNFSALRKGKVYGCNTSDVYFYEEVPFHPHWLLADLISIFHPEIGIDDSHRHYFSLLD